MIIKNILFSKHETSYKIRTIRVIEEEFPNLETLKKELTAYFEEYSIIGIKVEKFTIDDNFCIHINNGNGFKGRFSDTGEMDQIHKDLKTIGENYGIPQLGFPIYYYAK
jgi:hypothetical protein